ncbi:MAG: tyrosine-type recombinase/integrase [Gemmatimonadaceae bacterium]
MFTRRAISEHLASLGVSGSTKNRHRAALSGFAKFLVEREVLEHNPVRDVAASKPNRPRMRYLERRQAQALIASLPQPYRALEALMAGTGIEWGAAARLVDRDIDLEAGTVHAHGSKNEWRDRVVRITETWCVPHIEEHLATVLPGARVFAGVRDKAALHEALCHDLCHTDESGPPRNRVSP